MNRRDFVKNAFMAALATAISKPLLGLPEEGTVMTMFMDTSLLRNGDIITTSAYIPGTTQNIQFFIAKRADDFIAIRLDDQSVKIKIGQYVVVSEGRVSPPQDTEYSYYEESAPPLLDIKELSDDPVVLISSAWREKVLNRKS